MVPLGRAAGYPDKPQSDTRLRDDVSRGGCVFTQLVPEFADQDAQVVRIFLVAGTPHLAQQLRLRDEPTRLPGEQ
jgi:hypothetical protein